MSRDTQEVNHQAGNRRGGAMEIAESRSDVVDQYIADVADSQPLSGAQEVALASRIQQGDTEARAKLVEANLRFVIKVALEYQHCGLPLADLISAGNLGLVAAADRFVPDKGCKFITYAVWWIRQSILRALAEQPRAIRVPMNRLQLLAQIRAAMSSRRDESDSDPDEEEIAAQIGRPVESVRNTLLLTQDMRSLDEVSGFGGDRTLMEQTADEKGDPPDAQSMRRALQEEVRAAVESLDAREREVIRLYFGLDGSSGRNLREIATEFGLSRERVRQIKQRALRRLRHPARARKLVPYLSEETRHLA
jgi:RNA polymerase primary sigma factor